MKIQPVSELKNLERSVEQNTEAQRVAVLEILQNVKTKGDEALFHYTEKFDGVSLQTLQVTKAEIDEAISSLDSEMIDIITEAALNIREYHEKQRRQSWFFTREDGTLLGQKVTPLDSVGVYVPGGTAAYPSSVLMGVIPASVAGVEEIILVSPPGKDGKLPAAVLAAASIAGVKRMFKVGGAQAIGALAYGTESVPKTDKIVGPGNIFVALAKREVFGVCDIDMIAGPSEIAVLADETANARYIAADLLSQAEHDPRSAAVLVTTSKELAEKVSTEVEEQLAELPRKDIAMQAIQDYGAIYIVNSLQDGADVINQIAPEHLEIMTKDPMSLLGKIKHAGAIFLGEYSSEPVGDYFAGSNHVLPTSGTARFSSPLNVDDFTKKSSVIRYSEQAINENGRKIAAFARLEGLEAHARAIDFRLEDK
ncbi:histidinol dehydrogenase [Fictibacillus phosphorivorans]|uniref:Histidinol dehydrogenase n=1 Tax=Fictibacillus phosphorivorans TaxID=1221500 RepID=A0A163PZS1_9BACL|nr:histidinol dehydrogenase [Fictibacillus phosphorivorans]KZE64366.1 histidinol dehydrogenase [Fictibacillus phosphorivorans]